VEITHGNLLSNEEMIRQAFGQSSDSVVVGWLPVYHDMGLIGNLLQPIYSGGSCVLMSPMAFLRKPLRWLQAISRCRATTSGGPNFAYDLCVDRIDEAALADLDLSSWQVAFSGAEPVRAGTLERFAERFAPCGFRDEAFFPCYGLAEATLLVSGGELGTGSQVRAFDASALEAHRAIPPVDDVHGAGQELVACGHSWLDQEVLVVDPESCRQCLADQVGEIWVSGPAVARGYWRNPEASARDFGARLADAPQAGPFLRTGDLGFIADGALFVTGRLKDLIILRGRNLYPQDIERTVVTSHPALGADCAAFSVDLDGEERLIVVAERARRAKAEAGEVAEAARRAVAEVHEARIQDFLLLSTGTLPKTSSGKVRRRACRDGYLDDALAVLGRSATTPSGERLDAATFDRGDLLTLEPAEQRHLLERFLRRHLARVLGATDALDRHRPLTAVGLDSLAAVELSTAIEDGTGVAMTPATLLEGSSLTHLGEAILDRLDRADERAISAEGGVTGDHPLSYGQQALWFLHRLAPASGAYNISAAARLRGTLDSDRLRRCFEILVERHPALRTCFSQQGDALVQRVADTRSVSLAFEWQLEDAGQLGAEALRARLADAAYRPFELQELPLLRVLVLRRAADEHVLLLSVHHAVADFWSLAVLVDELGEVYASLSGGRSVLLPAVERRYTDFARWQQQHLAGSAGRRLEGYWRGQLAGQPTALDLPTDRPRPPVQTYRGSTRQRRLPDPLSAALDRLAQAQDATPFVTLLATFQTLLHRYSGQNDVVVGSPVSGRGRRELAGVVGYFVNPLALRSRLAGDPPFVDHLAATRRAVLDGLRYQDLPFDRLVDRLQPERDPSRSPVFQVMFSWQQAPPQVAARGLEAFALGQSGAQLELGGLHWESIELPQRTAQLDATLLAAPDTAGVRLSMQYNCDLFDPSTIDRLLGHFERLLAGACAAPDDRLSTLPLLGRSEQRELLHARNATRTEVPGDLAIQGLIAPWIRSTPDGVAITHGDSVLTYSALGRRTTALARRLRQLGLTAESRVAICLEPGPEMVIGLLAVLTAGGTYVPLDPAYPEERLAFMLRDARNASPPQILLTDRSSRERLSDLAEPGTRIVELDEASSASPESEEPEAGATVRGGSAAYVIYTSGSTGRPKGVVIPHRAVVNFLTSMARRPGLGASDALLAVTTLAFDISVLEIFLPLTVGGRLALVDRQTASDGRALAQALGDARATCMQATPATWRLLVEGGWQGESELRMLCGGEALPRELADRLLPLGGELWNMYGPTETTIWSATCPVESTGPVAIGGPIANTRIYLLGAHLEPVPVGAVGEVYIAGRGLARGYLGRPRLTAERFLPDPLATSGQGGRLYRVGDRARHLAPGGFDFLGRTDHQVKLRGFRIEPGEIESALAHHPAVGECAVVVRDAAAGDRRLEAYLVAEEPVPDVAELRQLLRRSLPEHMIPSAFIGLDEMPRTPNGKLDRTALRPSVSSARTLPAPGPATASIKTSEPTADDAIEAEVTELWQQVLGVTSVGRDESFFDVGGHSLLLARLHSRLVERFRRQDLTLVDLFRHPTITAQARFLRGEQPPSLAPVSGEPAPAGASEETEIAIVGLAGRFPGAADAGGLWQNLRQGVESIRFFSDDELADWVDARTLADPSYVKAQGVLDRAAHF
ncbi:MAG: amino acid adenylation domain-containing protein, partial [Acidobacteriota bacterium]